MEFRSYRPNIPMRPRVSLWVLQKNNRILLILWKNNRIVHWTEIYPADSAERVVA